MTPTNHTELIERLRAPSVFEALPGYPFLPCPICADEGFPSATESCDHTVLERARRTHPGLILALQSAEVSNV